MRDVFISQLLTEARKNKNIVLITGDLGFGVLDSFARDLPMQYFNAGVAEQNMTGVAAGMALDGKIVFTYSIGNFPTLRALEQIRNDAAYHDANVKVVCVGGGFSYGALGMSHHATEDIAIIRALPQVSILTPGCLWEAENCARILIETSGTCYLRLDKSNAGLTNFPGEKFTLGKMRRVRDGGDAVIFAMGGILENALKVADELLIDGIFVRVYSVNSIRPFDSEEVISAIRECKICFTLEEHVLSGGLGGLIAETCMDAGVSPSIFHRFGIRGGYSSIVGSQDYLRDRHGLSSQNLGIEVAKILKEGLGERVIDFIGALIGLVFFSPILLVFIFLVWANDFKNPFYFALRVTQNGAVFKMVKLRSMVIGADKTGVSSTSTEDSRITAVGVLIRKYKLDEITQLWNVLLGDMSLVGPRPNLKRDVDFYTEEERSLLKVKSGITDIASIVFSDEGEILKGKDDPDIAYNQLIRPAKSRLGLLYVDRHTLELDFRLCWLTLCTIASREYALKELQKVLENLNASDELKRIASRNYPLFPMIPPGASRLVVSRDGNTLV